MTLVELLVVISIMLLLVAIAIPVMRPAMESRQIREAARSVNVFFSTARSAAVEAGRPIGVEIARDANLTLAGTTLYQIEVPPPYTGDFSNSTLIAAPTVNPGESQITFQLAEDPVTDGLVQKGDVLKLNYKGHTWTITAISGNTWTFTSATAANPPNTNGSSVPFQILRQPTRSSAQPLRLPNSVVIDLQSSGTTSTLFSDTNNSVVPVRIMFGPNGGVYRLSAHTILPAGSLVRVVEPIYLTVGKRERVCIWDGVTPWSPPAEDGKTNLEDLENLWVTINPQTGFVSSAEMAPTTPGNVAAARAIAREMHSMGGR